VATEATEREKQMLYEVLLIVAPFVVVILAMAMGADITDDRFKNEEVD
jgi:hypothetical protein